jgi:CelD/BcsL family acetyltransferase involved in cellulose biosynthesis
MPIVQDGGDPPGFGTSQRYFSLPATIFSINRGAVKAGVSRVPTAISDFQISPVDGDVLNRLNSISRDVRKNAPALRPQIALHQNFTAIETDWLALEKDDRLSLHQSLAWCKAWVATHDNPVAIITGSISGHTVFILPLEIVTTPAGRVARFIGSPHANINTGLFDADFARAATLQLMTETAAAIAAALKGRADLVQLGKMPTRWRNVTNPFTLLPSIENQNHAFQLPLLATFEDTLSQLNAKRRRKRFRTSVRHLEASGGFDHIVATTEAEKRHLLQLFLHQKAVRFQASGLPNVFADAATQAFFEKAVLSNDDDSHYCLRLHAIRLRDEGGSIAAIAGLSRKGDHIICQFGSIDESVAAEASPGELLFHLMIEQANDDGVALFDFGIGDQLYKRNWCPIETVHRDVLIPVSLKGHIGVWGLGALTRLKAAIKARPQIYAFLQKIRARQKTAAPENPEK